VDTAYIRSSRSTTPIHVSSDNIQETKEGIDEIFEHGRIIPDEEVPTIRTAGTSGRCTPRGGILQADRKLMAWSSPPRTISSRIS